MEENCNEFFDNMKETYYKTVDLIDDLKVNGSPKEVLGTMMFGIANAMFFCAPTVEDAKDLINFSVDGALKAYNQRNTCEGE